ATSSESQALSRARGKYDSKFPYLLLQSLPSKPPLKVKEVRLHDSKNSFNKREMEG
ncbi:hypothetical protein AVEN_180186-1, partial [Araneus ventricosus]